MTSKLIVLACLLAAANARFVDNVNFDLSTLTSRIIGGHDARPGEFPHHVSLQWKVPSQKFYNFTHFCGGSILNDRWILTSAYCLVGLELAQEDPEAEFVVKAGKHDLQRTEVSEQTSPIADFFRHENFKLPQVGGSPYDIGLIMLKNPLRLNERVAPIALPKRDSEPTGEVILSAWEDPWRPTPPVALQTATLEIVDRDTCNKVVNELLEQMGMPDIVDLVDETNVCTGPLTGGKAPCNGDLGSPLINKDGSGNTELVGIVSWGSYPCGAAGRPWVYTRTSVFGDWIENVMDNN